MGSGPNVLEAESQVNPNSFLDRLPAHRAVHHQSGARTARFHMATGHEGHLGRAVKADDAEPIGGRRRAFLAGIPGARWSSAHLARPGVGCGDRALTIQGRTQCPELAPRRKQAHATVL